MLLLTVNVIITYTSRPQSPSTVLRNHKKDPYGIVSMLLDLVKDDKITNTFVSYSLSDDKFHITGQLIVIFVM